MVESRTWVPQKRDLLILVTINANLSIQQIVHLNYLAKFKYQVISLLKNTYRYLISG